MNKYELERGQTPLSFINSDHVVHELNTLPLSSRTVEEILGDHAIEFACSASYSRSALRRGPKRYRSEFVVDYLDNLADAINSIGALAAKQVRRHAALMTPVATE